MCHHIRDMRLQKECRMANSNVIPFDRRTKALGQTTVPDTDQSGCAEELTLALVEQTLNPFPVPVGSHPAVRQDKVEAIRQRLLTGLYNVDREKIARSMLKRQLARQLPTSQKLRSMSDRAQLGDKTVS